MIFSPIYKKRRLPTDRRTLVRITSVIYRKRKIYVIFCRMEKPCNPQLNYRTVIKIYPVFPEPNFRLSLHPLWSPSTKENLWTVYRQPPSIWESIRGNILFFFPKCPFPDRLYRKYSSIRYYLTSSHLEFIANTVNTFYIVGYIRRYLQFFS